MAAKMSKFVYGWLGLRLFVRTNLQLNSSNEGKCENEIVLHVRGIKKFRSCA